MDRVQIFILHWARKIQKVHPWNNALLNCIRSIQKFTSHPYEIIVIYSCDPEYLDDLRRRCPPDVKLVEDTKGRGASGARNIAVDLTETDYFVLLDNDMKVPKGWLSNLLTEIQHAERLFKAPCVIRPSFMPYLGEPPITRDAGYRNVLPLSRFVAYCRNYGIPCTSEGVVLCRSPWTGDIRYSGTGVTDNGWSLSVWIANRKAFDIIGRSDEEMHGWWGEDVDWAIRALKTPVKLLESHTVFIQHVESFTSGPTANMRINNADVFIKKHGIAVFNEVISGQIWPRLHCEQLQRSA
jgi:GT2 family glycosyltransferase